MLTCWLCYFTLRLDGGLVDVVASPQPVRDPLLGIAFRGHQHHRNTMTLKDHHDRRAAVQTSLGQRSQAGGGKKNKEGGDAEEKGTVSFFFCV